MDNNGLKVKYNVSKVEDGSIVHNCFVLRPDKDSAAIAALRAYADATDNRQLAGDILDWVGETENNPLTLEQLKSMEGQPVFGREEQYWFVVDYIDVVDEMSAVIHMTDGSEYDTEEGLPQLYAKMPREG